MVQPNSATAKMCVYVRGTYFALLDYNYTLAFKDRTTKGFFNKFYWSMVDLASCVSFQ